MSDSLVDAPDAALDDILQDLQELEPDQETILRAKFSRIYVGVATAFSRGASSRQILEVLKAKGLELHHAKFGKLYRAEVQARDEHGDRVYCVTCNQAVRFKEKTVAEAASTTGIDNSEEVDDER